MVTRVTRTYSSGLFHRALSPSLRFRYAPSHRPRPLGPLEAFRASARELPSSGLSMPRSSPPTIQHQHSGVVKNESASRVRAFDTSLLTSDREAIIAST